MSSSICTFRNPEGCKCKTKKRLQTHGELFYFLTLQSLSRIPLSPLSYKRDSVYICQGMGEHMMHAWPSDGNLLEMKKQVRLGGKSKAGRWRQSKHKVGGK